jgi:hypothetical protein
MKIEKIGTILKILHIRKIKPYAYFCSRSVIRLSFELKEDNKAEAYIVVPIRRRVVVPIGGATILRIVVPATTAIHTIRPFR